jgi:hypothetical protein
MDWKRGDPLRADQTGHPVEVIGRLEDLRPEAALPHLDHRWALEFWGDNKVTSRLKSWAHRDGDKLAAHFIAVRGGVGFHTDPGFVRYSVHLELFNGGWWTHGLEDQISDAPLFTPGLVSVLDTWSPHRVSRDERMLRTSPTKMAAAIDFVDYPPSVMDALDALIDHLPALMAYA